MSTVRCCTGAALGRSRGQTDWQHSAGCTGEPAFTPIPLSDPRHPMFGHEQWKAERARNLREQRRYEIVREACVSYRERGHQVGTEGMDLLVRKAKQWADAFLDEYEKP